MYRATSDYADTAKEQAEYWVLGTRTRILTDAAATAGAYSIVEVIAPRRSGPPPHVHLREEELFYVLAGEIDLLVGSETRRLRPGGVARVPRGVLHTFTPVLPEPARLVIVFTPAGVEDFFRVAGQPAGPPEQTPPHVAQADILRALDVAARYHMIIPPRD